MWQPEKRQLIDSTEVLFPLLLSFLSIKLKMAEIWGKYNNGMARVKTDMAESTWLHCAATTTIERLYVNQDQ